MGEGKRAQLPFAPGGSSSGQKLIAQHRPAGHLIPQLRKKKKKIAGTGDKRDIMKM